MSSIEALQLAITQLCDKFELTPIDLAYLARMNPQTMERLMEGKTKSPSHSTYQKIADALDIDYDDFLCWIYSADDELGADPLDTYRTPTDSGRIVTQRIRGLRMEAKERLIDVKKACGVRIDYERDLCTEDYSTLITLADYFDVSVDYILGRTENRKRYT